jgi:hypothetical protein
VAVADGTLTRSADLRLGALLALLVLAVNAESVSARLGFLHKAKQVKEYDHWRYIEMSRGEQGRPALQREPPYCYRVAVPAAARALVRLGLTENAAFYLLTSSALFGFLLLLWVHLGDLGFGAPLRATGIVLVGFTQGAVRWSLYQYWMTDPAGVFLVMLAFHLAERGRRGGLLATSVVAAFVRETYVLVYPYILLRDLRTGLGPVRAVARTVAIAALPLAVLVALRLVIPASGPSSFVQDFAENVGFRWRLVLDNQLYVLTIGSLGVLFPLALLFPGRLPGLVRRHFDRAFFVFSVYLSLTISNNTERPLAYALPVVVPAALVGLRWFLEETRLPEGPVLAVVVALQVLFWWGQRWAESGMSIYQPVNWTTVVALASAWVAAELLLLRARRRRAQDLA